MSLAEIPWRSSSTRVRRVSSQSTSSASASSRRTRSVTSSRLPIGVAQTASGTRRLLPESLEGDERRADQPGFGAELGGHDPDRFPGGCERLAREEPTGSVEEQVEG